MHGFKCRWRRDKLRHLAAKFHQLEAKPRFPQQKNAANFEFRWFVWGYYASTLQPESESTTWLSLMTVAPSPDLCFLQGTLLCLAKQTEQKFSVRRQGEVSLHCPGFQTTKTIQTPNQEVNFFSSVFPASIASIRHWHTISSPQSGVFSLRCDVWEDLELRA